VKGSNELGCEGASALVGILGKMINLKALGMVRFFFSARIGREKYHSG
jgi:hypothetical protein